MVLESDLELGQGPVLEPDQVLGRGPDLERGREFDQELCQELPQEFDQEMELGRCQVGQGSLGHQGSGYKVSCSLLK